MATLLHQSLKRKKNQKQKNQKPIGVIVMYTHSSYFMHSSNNDSRWFPMRVSNDGLSDTSYQPNCPSDYLRITFIGSSDEDV